MIEKASVPQSQLVFGRLVYWITVFAALICILGPLVSFIHMDENVINPHFEMKNIFDGMRSDFTPQELQMDVSAGATRLVVKDVGKFDDPEALGREVQIRIMDKKGTAELVNVTAVDRGTNALEVSVGLINSYKAGQTEVSEVTIWDSKGSIRLKADTQTGQSMLQLASVDRIDDPTAEHPITIMVQDKNNREEVLVKSVDREVNTAWLATPLSNAYFVADEASVTQVTDADKVKGGHFWLRNFTTGDGLTQFGIVIGCLVGIPAMLGASLFFAFKEKSIGWSAAAFIIAALIAVPALGLVNF